jgi:hypothetical protein
MASLETFGFDSEVLWDSCRLPPHPVDKLEHAHYSLRAVAIAPSSTTPNQRTIGLASGDIFLCLENMAWL